MPAFPPSPPPQAAAPGPEPPQAPWPPADVPAFRTQRLFQQSGALAQSLRGDAPSEAKAQLSSPAGALAEVMSWMLLRLLSFRFMELRRMKYF